MGSRPCSANTSGSMPRHQTQGVQTHPAPRMHDSCMRACTHKCTKSCECSRAAGARRSDRLSQNPPGIWHAGASGPHRFGDRSPLKPLQASARRPVGKHGNLMPLRAGGGRQQRCVACQSLAPYRRPARAEVRCIVRKHACLHPCSHECLRRCVCACMPCVPGNVTDHARHEADGHLALRSKHARVPTGRPAHGSRPWLWPRALSHGRPRPMTQFHGSGPGPWPLAL